MDFTLAALKLFCGQLRDALQSPSPTAMTLSGVRFQRAWLQGVLVSGSDQGRFLLDDGSDVVEMTMQPDSQPQQWKTGMYVMVVGVYVPATSAGSPLIKVHKIVDLSPFPDRESMWHLEVIEAYKMFYASSNK